MTNLNAKLMNQKLKKGWTASDFAEYLSTTEETFLEAVKETFSRNAANSMISTLRRNEKRRNQRQVHEKSSFSDTTTISDTSLTISKEEIETPCVQSDIFGELNKKLEDISKELFQKETTHKTLVSDRKRLYDSLRKYKEKMADLRKEIKLYQAEILEIADNISSMTDEMKKVNSEMKILRNELSEINLEIQKYSKFNIYVYESGEIDIEGEENFKIPETWSSLIQELTTNPEFECLTIRQIKQLAKLIVLVEALKEQDKTFEFTFESEVVQNYFEQFQTP